jgi:ORF6N domain
MRSASVLRQVERRIFLLRGQKVILDFDLAELYGVETASVEASSTAESGPLSRGLHV